MTIQVYIITFSIANHVKNHPLHLFVAKTVSIYKIPQIAAFQSGLSSISSKTIRNPSDISMWLNDFNAQALLLNTHEYFSGQVCFQLHPTCDAMFHLKKPSSTSPFNMNFFGVHFSQINLSKLSWSCQAMHRISVLSL